MTQNEALARARRLARTDGEWRFVVRDLDEVGGYATATEFDLDTYYAGESVAVCEVPPHGEVTWF